MAADTKIDLNSKMLVRYALKGMALGFVVMAAVLFFTRSPDTIKQIKLFPLELIPVILALVCGSWFCSGARLWVLSKALGYRLTLFQALVAGLAAEFGVAATPGQKCYPG